MEHPDVGMRYHNYTGHWLIPSVGFQIRWRTHVVSKDYPVTHWAPRFLIVTSHHVSQKVSLITSWGASWDGDTAVPRGAYTVNLYYSLTDRFGIFVESYGGMLDSDFDNFVDGGLAFRANGNFQLYLYSGFGINEGVRDFFVSAGISARKNRHLR